MTIGAAIFLATVGAILRYAVSDTVQGIDINTVGTILIIAGVVGLVAGLALEFRDRERRPPDRYPPDRYPPDRRYPDDRY